MIRPLLITSIRGPIISQTIILHIRHPKIRLPSTIPSLIPITHPHNLFLQPTILRNVLIQSLLALF